MLFSTFVKRTLSPQCVRTLFHGVACLWEGNVGRFADLSVVTRGLDIAVKPNISDACVGDTDQQHSEESVASVWLQSGGKSADIIDDKEYLSNFSAVRRGNRLAWSFNPGRDAMTALSKLTQPRLLLQVPLHCALTILARGCGDVFLDNMEMSKLTVYAEEGTCRLDSVKAESITVVGHRAVDILSHTSVHGNLKLWTADKGSIQLKRAQGHHINLLTDQGSINVAALYGEENDLMTDYGNVDLTCVHASASGSLALFCGQGNAHAHLDTFKKAELTVKHGDLQLSTASTDVTMNFHCQDADLLEGKREDAVRIFPKASGNLVGHFEGAGETCRSLINVECPKGSLVWHEKSWFESLRSQSLTSPN